MRTMVSIAVIAMTALLVACDTPKSRDAPPSAFDSDTVAGEIIAMVDSNRNGTLEPGEVTPYPALAMAFAAIDEDGSMTVSREELVRRLDHYRNALSGSVPACAYIRLDGSALAGATVTFEPEPFLVGYLKPAVGVTDENGRCPEFTVDGKRTRGLSAGMYRIKVEKAGTVIPARFNTATILGWEILTDGRAGEIRVDLPLSSQ